MKNRNGFKYTLEMIMSNSVSCLGNIVNCHAVIKIK